MDKFIIGGNSSGKTRKMLEEARKNDAIVICKHPIHMQNKANSYGIYGLRFINYEEVNADILCGKKIAVDELKDFFEYCYGAELDSFTMTID
jgi:hypothetical protein